MNSGYCRFCKYFVTDMRCGNRYIGYYGTCINDKSPVNETTEDDFCKKFEAIDDNSESEFYNEHR